MSKKALDVHQLGAGLEQVRCEAMAQQVKPTGLVDSGLIARLDVDVPGPVAAHGPVDPGTGK